jgi:hypothetical protein
VHFPSSLAPAWRLAEQLYFIYLYSYVNHIKMNDFMVTNRKTAITNETGQKVWKEPQT